MIGTYISSNTFSIEGDQTAEFCSGRRVKLNCVVDGTFYASIVSSIFATTTQVIIDENVITSNLSTVLYGVISPGIEGSLPDHAHSGSEGSGGTVLFSNLTDAPSTYSGTEDMYLKSTGSGTEWAAVQSSSVGSFLDLSDTPISYEIGMYLQTTSSGIDFVDITTISGIDGSNGTLWYYGTAAPPAQTLGDFEDFYFNTDLNYVYIKDTPSYGSTSLFTGGTWYVSSTLSSNTGNRAIDSNESTNWVGSSSSYEYWAYDLGEGNEAMVTKIELLPASGRLENYLIRASNDNLAWETLHTGISPASGWVDIEFSNTVSYRYYMCYIIDGYNVGWPLGIAEIKAFSVDEYDWRSASDLTGAAGENAPTTFSGLSDTPSTYSGIEGNYLRVTSSGIEAIDGIILTSPNSTDWLLQVTNSGILYTTEYS